jgi:hypothetical protein
LAAAAFALRDSRRTKCLADLQRATKVRDCCTWQLL